MEPDQLVFLGLICLGITVVNLILASTVDKTAGPQKPCHTIKQIHKWEYLQTKNEYGQDVWKSVCSKCKLAPGQIK